MKKISPRWLPAILAPVLVASSVFVTSGQATAVDLPNKSAAEMLAMINTDENISFSGRVIKKADLGLPPMNLVPDISQSMVDSMAERLPEEMAEFIPQASIEGELALILEFLAGTHRANLYVDGPTRARLQVLDLLSERNFIRNGKDLWFYDAAKSKVTHTEIDLVREAKAKEDAKAWILANPNEFPFDVTSPMSVAQYFLNEADATTNFAVDEDANIAGRDAYQLVMTPKSDGSLVESVKFGIDAQTGLPLAVTIQAVGQEDPAFEIAFETISFEAPAASLFEFTPPQGSLVEKIDGAELEKRLAEKASDRNLDPSSISSALTPEMEERAEAEAQRLKKEGWSAVVEIPADEVPAEFLAELRSNRLYEELTRKVGGGRIFSTALFTVLFTDDGAVYAGAVTLEKLLEAAKR
jgi:outer membrane lipoprotein-sorting protein